MAISKKKTWIIVILLILVITTIGIYRYYKSKFLGDQLPETVRTESKGLYRISYDTIIIDEVAGSMQVSNLVVAVDTAYLKADTNLADQPAMLINITADTLLITGVQTPKALLNKEISGRKLMIRNSKINLYRLHKKTKKEKDDKLARNQLEQAYYDVLSQLKLIKMDSIILENFDLTLRDFKTKEMLLRSSHVSVNLYDLLIDEGTLEDKTRIMFAKQLEVKADSIHIPDNDSYYDFRMTGLDLNTNERTLKLATASVIPRFGEAKFVRQFKTQKDRFDLDMSSISLRGILTEAISDGELHVDTMLVGKSSFKIFRDLNLPRDVVKRVGQYPHQIITKVPFPMEIKKAVFRNSFIEYREVNEKTDKPGEVQFTNVAATISNITNQDSLIARNPNMRVDFNALFLGMAKVDVTLNLRIGDKQGRFTGSGDLGRFEAKNLNRITEPMGLARVERGTVNSLHFDMTGNNYEGDGKLTMKYEDLKISSLKLADEEDEKEFKKKGFQSFLANVLVKNKNPSGGNLRSADMHTERNTNRSFFNIIWKTIFTGVKETVGMQMLGKKQKPDPDKPGQEKKKD